MELNSQQNQSLKENQMEKIISISSFLCFKERQENKATDLKFWGQNIKVGICNKMKQKDTRAQHILITSATNSAVLLWSSTSHPEAETLSEWCSCLNLTKITLCTRKRHELAFARCRQIKYYKVLMKWTVEFSYVDVFFVQMVKFGGTF